MKRTRQHIIEDESEDILKSLIPNEWVLRKLNPDYGIDYNVEIFENNQSTGVHFFIQLKGTDKESIDGNISFRIDKKYIDYFGKVSIPILFVYISVKSNVVWAKWLNSCAIDKENKSRALKFTSNDILNSSKINGIKNSISTDNSRIRIKYDGFKSQDENILERWVSFHFKPCLSSNDEIADEIVITLKNSSTSSMVVNIYDERFLINSDIEILAIEDSDHISLPEVDDIPACLNNILFDVSKILLIRKNDNALDVALAIIPNLELDYYVDIVSVINACITEGSIKKLEKLCESVIDNKNFNMYQFIYMALFSDSSNAEVIKLKEKSLLRAINISDDSGLTGTLCYNLANHYQNSNRIRDSIKYYLSARKYVPDYLNRGYWYRELAGMLFLEGKYTASSKLYATCITCKEFKDDPINIALAADSCFMARKLKKSLELFESYASKVTHPDTEYVLKKQILKTVRDEFGIKNNYSQNEAVIKFNTLGGNNITNSDLRECLALDPISPELRFKEGLILQEEKKHDEACVAFLISAIVTEYYPAAWLNSFFMALVNQTHMMGIVLKVAFQKCGASIIESMRDEVLNDKRIPRELKTQALDGMRAEYERHCAETKDNKSLNLTGAENAPSS